MACVDSCRHEALTISLDPDGFFRVDKNEKKCVACGLCTQVCPVLNPIQIDRLSSNLSRPFAAWCDNDELRKKSASGGAFAAISKAFLESGAVVYGAAIEKFRVVHKRVDSINDLPQLLGSKYQHSSMNGIHIQVKKDLMDGKTVLFSGLSCQVAAVIHFVGEKNARNLYTIDTICGGISTMLPMIRLKESNKYKGIISYRDKDNGWQAKGFKYALKMMLNDETIEDLGMNNMMLRCFCHKETKRPSCLNCQFNGFHRESDLTIGDYWGETHFQQQHYNGVSVVIVHSKRINSFLNASPLHMEPTLWAEVIRNNHSVYWTHCPEILKSYTRKQIFKFLRSGDEKKAQDWLGRKFLIGKLEMALILRKNEKRRKLYFQTQYENKSIDDMA